MQIKTLLNKKKYQFSFELFPPKTPKGMDNLLREISLLAKLNPAWYSITYGAGGSSQDSTIAVIKRVKREITLPILAHITCVGHSRDEIKSILDTYSQEGIHNILALRGDSPSNTNIKQGDFTYAADLVDFIRNRYPNMCIAVAGFPEGHHLSNNRIKEIEYLKTKVDSGADFIITQLFFDNNDYFDYVHRCRLANISVPIVPGIIPITSIENLSRMADMAPHSRFPAKLLQKLDYYNQSHTPPSPQEIRYHGASWAARQIQDLLEHGVPGIHLYTLNKSQSSMQIFDILREHNVFAM